MLCAEGSDTGEIFHQVEHPSWINALHVSDTVTGGSTSTSTCVYPFFRSRWTSTRSQAPAWECIQSYPHTTALAYKRSQAGAWEREKLDDVSQLVFARKTEGLTRQSRAPTIRSPKARRERLNERFSLIVNAKFSVSTPISIRGLPRRSRWCMAAQRTTVHILAKTVGGMISRRMTRWYISSDSKA